MNFFFVTIAILLSIYFVLKWFVRSSSKKISIYVRKIVIFSSILLAVLALVAGRYIFSLPFLLAILPLIKTKAGITLFQVLTLSSWENVMLPMQEIYPFAWVYFISFILICSITILNLVIAILVDVVNHQKD